MTRDLRNAADLVHGAADSAGMRQASDALASGMQAVGLDRWRPELAAFAARAQSAPQGSSTADGARRYTLTLSVGGGRVINVAIDFDPRSIPMSADAEEVGRRVYAVAVAIEIAMQGYFTGRTVQSAASTLHALFARKIEELKMPGVTVEDSFRLDGDPARNAEKGSVRVDVIYRNPRNGRIEGIWDWKVGGARLDQRRAQELSERASRVAGTPNLPTIRIPVRELHITLTPTPSR